MIPGPLCEVATVARSQEEAAPTLLSGGEHATLDQQVDAATAQGTVGSGDCTSDGIHEWLGRPLLIAHNNSSSQGDNFELAQPKSTADRAGQWTLLSKLYDILWELSTGECRR
jgi:hypothetical protein